MEATVHILGVRHHGPGSARSLVAALTELQPDCILLEGPPEAEAILPLAAREDMTPPVALLLYDPERPQRASYYPFAEFSPEWNAIRFALKHSVPLRFMDLPQAVRMGMEAEREAAAGAEGGPLVVPVAELAGPPGLGGAPEPTPEPVPEEDGASPPSPKSVEGVLRCIHDPLQYLAEAAGYADSEQWWEHMVEHRVNGKDVFAAVLEGMTALREAAVPSVLERLDGLTEARREACMRQRLRAARKEGWKRIAVVCGAWHGPALATLPPAKEDVALLKDLPARKVAATWIPWTYGRLAAASGYGAGVASPGWYDFLWSRSGASARSLAAEWLIRTARLLREEGLEVSSANVIEAVRLAETLAAVRGRPLPGLAELTEATQSVISFGDPLPLRLIAAKLIVSERLGRTPEDTPMAPLAQDLARQQKRLRLPATAEQRTVDLDLRKPNDLDRSHLLHRLLLLGVGWGERQELRGTQRGTFHEVWRLAWEPEFEVALIEAGVWGNTLPAAAAAKAGHTAAEAEDLAALCRLVDVTLQADLPDAAAAVIRRLQEVSALAGDVGLLMDALPPLVQIRRYGNVRQTDAAMVGGVVEGLVSRICVGLPAACGSLNDEAAEEMFARLLPAGAALGVLQQERLLADWHEALRRLADAPSLHGLIAGRAVRLLLDAGGLTGADAARRLGLALSVAAEPGAAASWVDGFLRGSGLLLVHDETLRRVLDEWLSALPSDHFTTVLPLLRRTFSSFQAAERRQLGAGVATPLAGRTPGGGESPPEVDEARGARALALAARLLGLDPEAPASVS